MVLTKQNKNITTDKNKFPPEIRVAKEAFTFLHAGYQSAVISPPYDNQTDYELWNGIEIFRPQILKSRNFFEKLISEITFFSPFWCIAVKQIIKKYSPDILHIHDIWLVKSTLKVSSTQKIVVDLHENMPAAVLQFNHGYSFIQKYFRKIFHSYNRVFDLEKYAIKRSDLILVVVEEV